MSEPVRIGIDIGGTFTDVALEKGSARFTTKTLTTHTAPEDGVLTGLKTVVEEANVAPSEVALVIHGTTLATNALIERKGAKTALLTTEGFRDVLQIRAEDRFEQYDLTIEPPEPLVPRALRLPVAERVDVSGAVRRTLDEAAVARAAEQMEAAGVEAVAVGFLHSYAAPAHEERAREILAKHLPGVAITLSGEVAPEMREYERFSTAVANAYVQPLMAGYLDRLEKRLAEAGVSSPLLLMLSSGGLTTVETAKRFPVRLVESGPAGGAAFAADIARRHGLDTVLSFDMGGTTAKLCLVDRATPRTSRAFEVARVWRFRKGSGLPLR
ncbi:MAG: hydantoinase/oxoprolinase family protein, partial [Pseudomonadota bacterium]